MLFDQNFSTLHENESWYADCGRKGERGNYQVSYQNIPVLSQIQKEVGWMPQMPAQQTSVQHHA